MVVSSLKDSMGILIINIREINPDTYVAETNDCNIITPESNDIVLCFNKKQQKAIAKRTADLIYENKCKADGRIHCLKCAVRVRCHS